MIKFFRAIPRLLKTAVLNVFRHFAICLSASSVVSITLFLLSAFLLVAGNVSLFADSIESDLSIHVVLDKELKSEQQIASVKAKLEQIQGVKKLRYSSPEDELAMYIEEQGEEFRMFSGDKNPLSAAFFVTVKNGDQIKQINKEISNVEGVKEAVYGGQSVSSLIRLLNALRFGGLIFIALLGFLALFLIRNSIKLAIYTRRSEISIMRNVGATNGYIKVPFILEGMIIGCIGAIIPCLITYFGYDYLYQVLDGQLLSSLFALQPVYPFVHKICLILVATGVLVGFIGSFLSTTKYLHWKR